MEGMFNKKRTFTATVHGIRLKMVKPKKGGERGTAGGGVEKKMAEVTLHVPLSGKNKRVRDLLPPSLAAMITESEVDDQQLEFAMNKLLVKKVEHHAALTVFSDEKGDIAEWACGGAGNDDPARVTAKSFVVVEKVVSLVMVVLAPYGKMVWMWGGENANGGECKVCMIPTQTEFEFEDGEKKGEESQDPPATEEVAKAKWRKKDESKTAAAAEPQSAT